METKTNGFDFASLQKQFIDSAINASKNWMDFSKQNDFQKLMSDWASQMTNGANWQNLTAITPEQVKKWADLQMSFYAKMAEMVGASTPNSTTDFFKAFTSNPITPVNWANSFETLQGNWGNIIKSIQFKMYDNSAVSHFFSNDILKENIGKMMGFNMINNIQNPIKEVESYFTKLVDSFKENANQLQNLVKEAQSEGMPNFNNMYGIHVADSISQMLNQSINSNFGIFSKLFPVQDRDELIEAIKNIQFSYMSFLYKSYAMQMMLAEKGLPALPETIKTYSEIYAKDGSLPDYETFLTAYINNLETNLIAALNTKEFSVAQAEVANAMVTSKKQVEIFKELLFKELPFVKYAEFDDLLLEISTLRKKNRQLESRLRAIEEKLSKPAEKPEKTEKKVKA